MSLFTWEPRTYEADEEELALTLGAQAALAVRNAEHLWEERLALRLEELVQQAERLEPRDRALLEQLLTAAERIVDLAEERGSKPCAR
jgi:hypothetical protein